jgi:geranylgeranyl reductase family protein
MIRRFDADVIVLGLGPAGASAAAEAARRGCRVLAFDRKREPGRPVQCAEFVPAMISLDVECVRRTACQPIRAMMTRIEDGASCARKQFPGWMLERADFDAALVDDAIRAGAKCRFRARARRVALSGTVQLSGGELFSGRVIIGADGPRSLVGRAMGQANTEFVHTRQVTVPLNHAHDATDIFLSSGIRGGYAWLFPKRDTANLGAGVAPAHTRDLKRIVASLHEALAETGRVGRQAGRLTGGPIPVGGMRECAERFGAVLLLLAGDAGGLANPITGAGIAAAVLSGRLAGEAAAAWVAGAPDAGARYREELETLLKPSLERAVRRRRELAARWATGTLSAGNLRRGWIAYPEYWAA